MLRLASISLSVLLSLGGLSADEHLAFTVESDQEVPFNDEQLSVQVSSDDLLSGASFTSNLPLPKGHPGKLTDGEGHEFIQGSCTFGENSTEDWVVTFSDLKIEELHEVRVFSSNRDGRSQQDYDVSISEDRGKTFRLVAKDVIAGQRGGYNLTRVPVKAGRVTDLRFTFRNPNERNRPESQLHSALYEIDATGIALVVPSLSEVREKGRQQSRFLAGRMSDLEASEIPQPDLAGFEAEIRPLLEASCVQCHGPEKQKGKFRVDTLNPDLHTGPDVDWWLEVLAVLSNHEMPPEDEGELADVDRSRLIDWLSQEVQVASRVRRAEAEHTSFRRLTRYEYTNTIQDLLGLPYEFGADLPPETASEDGFRNSSEMLSLSAMQFETYRNLARSALEKATVRGEQPPTRWVTAEFDSSAKAVLADVERRVEQAVKKGGNPNLKAIRARADARQFSNWLRFKKDGRTISAETVRIGKPSEDRPKSGAKQGVQLVLNPVRNGGRLRSRQVALNLGRGLPDDGNLLIRVHASRTSTDNPRIPVIQLTFGFGNGNNGVVNFPVGESKRVDALPGKPEVYEWMIPLSEIQRNPLRDEVVPGRSSDERIALANVYPTPDGARFDDLPAIQVDCVEIAWPFYKQWPPKSHRRVFPDTDVFADAKMEESSRARRILSDFLGRAWRQPVEEAELDRMMSLFSEFRPLCEDFEEAVLEVLAVGLASPRFLYLVRESGAGDTLTDYELATRLSYFLWCSMPDEKLLQLAENGNLRQPKVLSAQVQRMLRDPRSKRFSEQFVHQWLSLEMLDILTVDREVHPTFNEDLKTAMHGEIIAFFEEIITNNRSVIDFIESDYALVNERLAQHYRLREVHGPDYQRVSLRPEDGRGGLLTQGGVLAMTSNGIDSNPLRRGVWLLENLLHDPPPPPPPAVPEIDVADPEIAKMTLKQRLEQHRNDAACQSCHERIDPWGIAFENFDAIGNWRTTANNKPVDSHAILFNKEPLDGMEGLKRYLLENRQDQFVEALAHKMTTFALGRPLSFGDRSHITRIAADLRHQDDGLATLIHLIVQSEIFRTK